MIRTGQTDRHSKWYIFVNDIHESHQPFDTEEEAEEEAQETYPEARILTTDDKAHPVHTNPWPPSGSPTYQQVKKAKAKTVSKKLLTVDEEG